MLQASCSIISYIKASCALGVVESALRRWVGQRLQERTGVTPHCKALTPEQQNIQGPGLISKQPGSHVYKKATLGRPDTPNTES